MRVDFKNMPDNSRIWIYQSDRDLKESEISIIDYKNFDGKEMLIPDSTNLYLIICDSSNDFSLTDTKTGNIYSPIMKIYSKVFGEAYNQKFGGNDYFYTRNNNSSLGSSLSLQTH